MKKTIDIISRCIVEETYRKSTINVSFNDYGFVDIIPPPGGEQPKYDPTYTENLLSFINDFSYPHKIVIGPYGSGKTSAMINTILRDAVIMPPCDDGIRKYKVAIIRNTASQLETTTLASWLFWTRGLPQPTRNKKPQLTYSYRFRDNEGEIHLDVLFLALDREDTISKLDSLELSAVYFNELRHISHKIFDAMLSRIGRYPFKIEFIKSFEKEYEHLTEKEKTEKFKKWHPFVSKLYADTNAPKNRHWIAELEKQTLSKLKIYHQPPALIKDKKNDWVINEMADNLSFVGEQYYLDMIDRGEEFIKVYAQGKYGTLVDGKPVFPYYNDEKHSIDDIPVIKNSTLYIGCDYGTIAPAVLITQFHKGQIRCVKEFCGEYQTIKNLWQLFIIPFLNLYCKDFRMVVVGDPANTANGVEQLQELGIFAEQAITNTIEKRISAVSNALNESVGRDSRILISRKHCPVLREGMLGEYHYRLLHVVGSERAVDTPNKTHPYSDIQDCLQYIVMKIFDDINYEKYNADNCIRMPKKDDNRSKITGY